MRVFLLTALALMLLSGCGPREPEVQILEVVKKPVPIPDEEPPGEVAQAPAAEKESRPNMTEVLEERGIPDGVRNDGKKTIWIYDGGPQGGEQYTFEKGKFVDHKYLQRSPSSRNRESAL